MEYRIKYEGVKSQYESRAIYEGYKKTYFKNIENHDLFALSFIP